MNELPLKFYGSIKDWRFPWILGLIFFFLEVRFHLQLFHFYVYLFTFGVISIIYERLGWGELTQTGLKVRFGILRLLKLCIDREMIEKISTITEIYHTASLPGFGAMYDEKGFEKQYILIMLKSVASDNIIKLINNHRVQMLFGQKINLGDSNKAIVIEQWPACGIEAFFNSISSYISTDYDLIGSSTVCMERQKMSYIDFGLLLLPVAITILCR